MFFCHVDGKVLLEAERTGVGLSEALQRYLIVARMPEIVVAGEHSTGKTTLIARLLRGASGAAVDIPVITPLPASASTTIARLKDPDGFHVGCPTDRLSALHSPFGEVCRASPEALTFVELHNAMAIPNLMASCRVVVFPLCYDLIAYPSNYEQILEEWLCRQIECLPHRDGPPATTLLLALLDVPCEGARAEPVKTLLAKRAGELG
jgi:hypothetical protein